jgi:glycosyltransferase involved in cell wall biosynthesis
MEQTIVPRAIEEKLLAEAQQAYPGWEPDRSVNQTAAYLAGREQEEWQQADLIVCGSEFVRDGIGLCGGPKERCVVVPYGVDSYFAPVARASSTRRPLRVLIAGQVGLRKGAGCAGEVAKALRGIAEFRWAGPVSLLEPAKSELARQIELLGMVPRHEIGRHYQWADVFFLPSICEGSATVTYEALASGLPVVTTPNAGSIVRPGVDGFVVPVYDVAAMIEHLRRLAEDRGLLAEFSRAAALRAADVSLAAYQDRFIHQVANAADKP